MKKLAGFANKSVEVVMTNSRLVAVACLAACAMVYSEKASAVATLADIGVDLADYVPLMVTAIGATVAVIVGAWAAFKLLKITFAWAGKMGG